jgi:hypothetical protein
MKAALKRSLDSSSERAGLVKVEARPRTARSARLLCVTGAVVPHKEEVLPAQCDASEGGLGRVVVERDLHVVEEVDQRVPQVERVTNRHPERAFRWMQALLFAESPTMRTLLLEWFSECERFGRRSLRLSAGELALRKARNYCSSDSGSHLRTTSSRSIQRGSNRMQPPWEKASDPPGSLRWKMGPGEDYFDRWVDWFMNLEPLEQSRILGDKSTPRQWRNLVLHVQRLNQLADAAKNPPATKT